MGNTEKTDEANTYCLGCLTGCLADEGESDTIVSALSSLCSGVRVSGLWDTIQLLQTELN